MMALQNRADPFGNTHADSARGMFTGNRGIIHDPATKTLTGRRWTTKSWIVCTLTWKNIRREPMGRNGRMGNAGWTELFFLDEVTALASGHRPCFSCRLGSARSFAAAFSRRNGLASLATAPAMDKLLHSQRRLSAKTPPAILSAGELEHLPYGAMFECAGNAHAVRGGMALPWSFSGYGEPVEFAVFHGRHLALITPPAVVETLRGGYLPEWHSSTH